MTVTTDHTTAELLAVVLARELGDEAVGILGTRSEIGYAACRLAQATNAPGLWFVSGPSGVVNPGVDAISPIAGYALFEDSEAHSDLTDNIDAIDWSHRFFDFAILGGLQVDRFGNLNTVVVGDWSNPTVRGPGPIGASVLAAHAGLFYIVMPDHSTRSFRPVVDFVSAVGFGRTGTERAALGLPGGGPVLLLSPLGTFDFTPDTRELRIRTLHPGVTTGQVQEATGFTVHLPAAGVATTTPPTEHELTLLRETIDRTRALS